MTTASDKNKQSKGYYLVSLVGHAGSGKSHFARELALHKQWVRLNGDSMRMALFGSLEAIQAQPIEFRRYGIFGAVDYAVEQILMAKKSVIYDANNNKRSIREAHRNLAEKYGAIPIVVWIYTSKQLAIERTMQREAQPDQRKFDEKSAIEVVERHIAALDEPTSDENLITIDGTLQVNEQIEEFDRCIARMTNARTS